MAGLGARSLLEPCSEHTAGYGALWLPRTYLHLGQRSEVAREAPAGVRRTFTLASLLPFPGAEQMVLDEWAPTPPPHHLHLIVLGLFVQGRNKTIQTL